ncbi:MAG: BrnT family toxin [Acidobacteria bacterium]|nr:BrnT family toxin [Acidobacteriota bacterium]
MKFEWDHAKNQSNQWKHGLNFADALLVFAGRTLTFEDLRRPCGEPRYLTVGTLTGRVVIIAHTLRGDATRIISMRKANARERARYQERLGEGR